MWTILCHHGRLGDIVDTHYFSQMSWPVSLFIFPQLPNHLHNGLMRPFHQPIHLGVVRHGSQLLHAEEFTYLINDAAHKVCTPITQEPGWGTKDWDVTLIQSLGDCLSCLTQVSCVPLHVLCEMVLEQQHICDLRWSVQLLGHLYASKVCMQEVHQSSGHNQVWRHYGQIALMLEAIHAQDLIDCHIWLVIPGHQKHSPKQRQGMIISLMTHISVAPIQGGDTMSHWRPWRVEDLWSHLWALSAGTRPLDEL